MKAGVEECVLRDRFVSSKFAAVSIIAEQLPAGEKMIVFVSNSSGGAPQQETDWHDTRSPCSPQCSMRSEISWKKKAMMW